MSAIPGKTYQLAELTNFIRRVFALNLPQPVWVSAELGQSSVSRGNYWLTLVEKDAQGNAIVAQLDGVIWKSQLATLQRKHGVKLIRDILQDGMSVRLKVTTSFHERYGLRLVVDDLDPSHTIGELEQRRQETLQRLAAERLLDKNSRVNMSRTPQRLAVISSETAAGLADFREQLESNPYGYQFSIRLFPAAMQGTRTGPEVVSRLNQITSWGEVFDAVVIVRGGGGRTDLAAFDDEELARAVANYHLPVVSGIGHETDKSILDQVAHTSLKTPTATAVYFVERLVQAEYQVLQLGRSIQQHAQHTLQGAAPKLQYLKDAILRQTQYALQREKVNLDNWQKELHSLPARMLSQETSQLAARERLLGALRPETTLARGFAIVSQRGKFVSDPNQLVPGELEIRLKEGRVKVIKPDA